MLFGEPYQEFDRIGAQQVQVNLGLGRYGEAKAAKARLWLADLVSTHTAKKESEDKLIVERQLSLAESAKDAAWEAALAAKKSASAASTANNLSAVALAVSLIAIAVAIIGIFIGNTAR